MTAKHYAVTESHGERNLWEEWHRDASRARKARYRAFLCDSGAIAAGVLLGLVCLYALMLHLCPGV